MTANTIPPISDYLALSLRAFAESTIAKQPKKASKKRPPFASKWAVIFDTETTPDASQALRIGTYQVRKSGELKMAGVFYDPDGVTDAEHDAHEPAGRHRLVPKEQGGDRAASLRHGPRMIFSSVTARF